VLNPLLTPRAVRPDDLDIICSQRLRMFEEDGRDAEVLVRMNASFREWLRPRLADGRYFGFLIEDQGEPVAGIGLFLLDWPPHFLHPTETNRGYICNVFVEGRHRGRGISKAMMELAEEEFARRGVHYLVLHASKLGRPVYDKLGWDATSEMAKAI